MSDLSDLVHRLMRDVTLLNPMEPGAHFLAMLEAKGLTIVKKIEADTQAEMARMTQRQAAAATGLATAERLIAEAKAKRAPKT